jgi:uncharacterized coiled-coil protein SlyX
MTTSTAEAMREAHKEITLEMLTEEIAKLKGEIAALERVIGTLLTRLEGYR